MYPTSGVWLDGICTCVYTNFDDVVFCSPEPAVPGEEEEAVAVASPEPEQDLEKESEPVELKSETLVEAQADTVDDATEKSQAAAPTTVETAPVSAEPVPAAPEENRVMTLAHAQCCNVAS